MNKKPGLGAVSISTMDSATRRQTILLWTDSIGRWSVAWSDSRTCLLKQPPGFSGGGGGQWAEEGYDRRVS